MILEYKKLRKWMKIKRRCKVRLAYIRLWMRVAWKLATTTESYHTHIVVDATDRMAAYILVKRLEGKGYTVKYIKDWWWIRMDTLGFYF